MLVVMKLLFVYLYHKILKSLLSISLASVPNTI